MFNLYQSIIKLLLTIGLIVFSANTFSATLKQDYWPTEEWRYSTPEEQGVNSAQLIKMLQEIKDKKYAVKNITVVRNGYIVLDTYLYPLKEGAPKNIYSNTKSIVSALTGIAIDKGYIDGVDSPVVNQFSDKNIQNIDSKKQSITLKHLLTMSSGLKDSSSWGFDSSSKTDWVKAALDVPMHDEYSPGERLHYSNQSSHIVTGLLQKKTQQSVLDFANQHLFSPLGIKTIDWQSDPAGTHMGYSNLSLTPKDRAKIGLLFLNNGRWEDQQIISEEWVKESTSKQIQGDQYDGYGYFWQTPEEGKIKDDLFTRSASPAHQLTVPADNIKRSGVGEDGDQIFKDEVMHIITKESGREIHLASRVSDIPDGMTLEDIGPKAFARMLMDSQILRVTELEILSNEKVILNDGVEAYKTDMTFTLRGQLNIGLVLLSIYREGKWLHISYDSPLLVQESSRDKHLKKAEEFFSSLVLN